MKVEQELLNTEKAILRADISDSLGRGHLTRSIALCETLRSHGIDATVYCRDLGGKGCSFHEHIRSLGKTVREVNSEEEFIQLLLLQDARYVFLDLMERCEYNELLHLLENWSNKKSMLITLGDFYIRRINYSLVVRPFHEDIGLAENILEGLQYFIFSSAMKKSAAEVRQKSDVKRVLITLGGSDQWQSSLPIARRLSSTYPGIRFTVVIGPGFDIGYINRLKQAFCSVHNVRCKTNPSDMSKVYLRHDAAIVSGGISKFEATLFGLPTIIIANSSEEERLAPKYCALGIAKYGGSSRDLDTDRIQSLFEGYLLNSSEYAQMSVLAGSMMDGNGGDRVVEYVRGIASPACEALPGMS